MGQHAAYWQPYLDSDRMVVFGPVLAARDPAVTSGTANIEVGKMLAGFVRPS